MVARGDRGIDARRRGCDRGFGGTYRQVTHTTARYALGPVEQGNVDADPPGTSLGDQTVSRNVLRRGGRQVGSLVSACTFTGVDPKPVLLCDAVAQIDSSQLALMVRIPPRFLQDPQGESFRLAITGGTGRYRNARGYGQLAAGSESITFNITTNAGAGSRFLLPRRRAAPLPGPPLVPFGQCGLR